MSSTETAGGIMYHDAGFAGLPEQQHPTSGLLNKEVHAGSGGQGEVPNGHDKTVIERPLSVPGSLLLK